MITFLRRSPILSRKLSIISVSGPGQVSTRRFFSSPESASKKAVPKEDANDEVTPESPAGEVRATEETPEYEKVVESVKKSEAEVVELHRKLLFKYAEAENKRRERLEEIKRRDTKHIASFAEKALGIFDSLEKVCTLAQSKAGVAGANDKVKSFSEGLVMTRDIMRNILSKHNVVSKK